LNENSKSWAFYEEMPELNHNAVLGTRLPPGFPERTVVVMLSSADDHSRNRLRYQVTRELLERDNVEVHNVEARGTHRLARMLSTVHYGDFVSYYLAMLNGANPTDTGAIEGLKKELAERG
jgi:glucose/mannose-6-phosphate isomerase